MGPFRAPAQVGKTALHNAAKNGLVAVMEALAAKGANLNAATKVRAPLRSLMPGGKERRGKERRS